MPEIAIITDSLASIPDELVEKYRIKVAPQILIWGPDTYQDGIDISPNEFYARLKETDVMPTSSQVPVMTFKELFDPLVTEGIPILAIVASSKLTMTINSAEQAKAMFPGAQIEIVDSLGASMSLGFQVLAACRAVEEGKSFEDVVSIARRAKEYTGVIFVVDTLEYLHRGGRIGGASRLLGTMLDLKPLLELQEGKVEALEQIRTKRKAINRLVDIMEERVNGTDRIRLAALHTSMEDEARALLDEIDLRCCPIETIFTEVSPVLGIHTGPGTVGLAYYTGP